MEIYYSAPYKRFATQLQTVDLAAHAGIAAGVQYLGEFGPAAVAPDVKWRLEQSTYRQHSGEVRWPWPEHQSQHGHQAWRSLFVAATDGAWAIMTVLDNKLAYPGGPDAWYDKATPFSDAIAADTIERLRLKNPPSTKH